jgi:23S rRNA (uracil1939-C5)-methyltransferase
MDLEAAPEHDDASTTRVICEHADRCAGCPLIALPYSTQLAHKRARLVEAFASYPTLELTYVQATLPAAPITGYRTRAKLVVAQGEADEGIVIGLYASGGGHVVLDTSACRVVSPAIAEVATAVRELAAEPGSVLARSSQTGSGTRSAPTLIRAIDLREANDNGESRVLVTLVASRDDVRTPELVEELREAARTLRRKQPRIVGVALNLREGDSPQVLGNELMVLDGESTARDRIGPVSHFATFGAFVQAHRGQAHRVHEILADAVEIRPGEQVLDLYGGSGAIGLSLAARGADVLLVESFAPAAKLAMESAKDLGDYAGAFEATPGEVSEVLTRLGRRAAQGEKVCDVIIINPPRRGVAPLVREQITLLRPRAIGYVSCDPETLARDIDHFRRLGYAPTLVQPLDMIPLTDEVETVTILKPAAIPPPRVAYSDDEVVIVEKSAHEPTTPQGEYASSLLARVRTLPGCEHAVPVHRLDVGTSGLVIFARNASFVSSWAEALAAATGRKIYLAAARGRSPSKGAITRDLRDEGRLLAARTRYRWLGGVGGHSVLRVIPEHGRTHQIRRHLAAIGHPVLGDERYGHAPSNRFFEEKHGLDRTFLHCIRLELNHPHTGLRLIVETPLPGDLRLSLMRCGGPNVLRFLEGKAALGGAGPSTLPPPPSSARDSMPPPSSARDSMLPPSSRMEAPVSITILEPPDVNMAPMSIRPPIPGSGDDDE